MDAFFASIEQLDRPELRGRPLLIGGTGRRGVVCTASYEARPFGVGSAMPMARARKLCPQAVVIAPRMARYVEVSRQIMAVFRGLSPRVEALSLDEAFLDMTGSGYATPGAMSRQIKQDVAAATGGLSVSVGVANSKFLAKLASDYRKPDGLTVVRPERVRTFLDPLPVRRLWGVGAQTEPRLLRLGLRTIADVYQASEVWLKTELGKLGSHLYRLAHNLDCREVVPHREAKSIGAETTLEHDVDGMDAVMPHLLRHADRVARSLRRRGYAAGGVRVKLKTRDFETRSRQRVLRSVSQSADELYQAACALLPGFCWSKPLRLIGLSVYRLQKPAPDADLFSRPSAALDRTLDDVVERFGPTSIGRASRRT